jgi:hypothetical protein
MGFNSAFKGLSCIFVQFENGAAMVRHISIVSSSMLMTVEPYERIVRNLVGTQITNTLARCVSDTGCGATIQIKATTRTLKLCAINFYKFSVYLVLSSPQI